MAGRIHCCSALLGVVVLILAGCAPKQRPPEEPGLAPPPTVQRVNEAVLMREAEDLFDQKNFRGAAGVYRSILENFPGSPLEKDARYRLALCYHHLDEPLETVRTLRQLVGVDLPVVRQLKIFSLMAESYLDLGRPFDSLRWHLAALETADHPDLRTRIREKIRQVLSENLSEAELREIAFIYRDTYLEGYAKFLLAQHLLWAGEVDLSRQMISDLLRFHSQEDFYPEVQAFLEQIEGFRPDEYVLGCILPLSGKGAIALGEPSLNGIKLAIHAFEPDYDRINLRLAVRDSKSSPAEAAQAVEELVRDEGVLAIVGPLLRTTSEAAAEKAEELQVPLITLTTKEDITEERSFVFRNGLSYSLQIRSLVTYATEYLGLYRFAVFYPDDGYGKTLGSLFIDEVYRHGAEVVTLETYTNTQMDFGQEIRRMVKIQEEKAEGRDDQNYFRPIIEFDGIFIPDRADRVAQIVPQLAYYNIYGVTLMGTNTWNDPSLPENAGRFIEGALLVDEFFRGSESPVVRDFVDQFRRAFSVEPTILAAQAFDATRILVNLLEGQPILSREAMRGELTKVHDFYGVSGFHGFDPNGNARKSPFLLRIEGNVFKEVAVDLTESLDREPLR